MSNSLETEANAVITVSLPAIKHNLNLIKNHLPERHSIMAVVKADAYGHGAGRVARFLDEKVAMFAVNSVDEGIDLRNHGVESPILVFGVPEKPHLKLYSDSILTATISSVKHLEMLPSDIPCHLNIDTGMGRLGITPDELPQMLEKVQSYGIRCTGAYSHFATADQPDSFYAKKQFRLFRRLTKQLPEHWTIHMANSGGILFYPQATFDMVRTGIALYGYPPGKTAVEGLKPALKFQTRLVHINRISKGHSVSYGAGWSAPKHTNIGIIPVGYQDGIPRNLTGNLEVKIEGHHFPVVGTITMNYCMVDLGDCTFEPGTLVELFDGYRLTAKTWADHLQTIPYEILTGISSKIPRKYEV